MWHHHHNIERENALAAQKKFEEAFQNLKLGMEAERGKPFDKEDEEELRKKVGEYIRNKMKQEGV